MIVGPHAELLFAIERSMRRCETGVCLTASQVFFYWADWQGVWFLSDNLRCVLLFELYALMTTLRDGYLSVLFLSD